LLFIGVFISNSYMNETDWMKWSSLYWWEIPLEILTNEDLYPTLTTIGNNKLLNQLLHMLLSL